MTRKLYFILLSFAILVLSNACKKSFEDSCEKNLSGEYCVEIGNPGIYYGSGDILYFQIVDNETGEIIYDVQSLHNTVGANYCTTITVPLSSKMKIIRLNYEVNNISLAYSVSLVDTVQLCKSTKRFLTL